MLRFNCMESILFNCPLQVKEKNSIRKISPSPKTASEPAQHPRLGGGVLLHDQLGGGEPLLQFLQLLTAVQGHRDFLKFEALWQKDNIVIKRIVITDIGPINI